MLRRRFFTAIFYFALNSVPLFSLRLTKYRRILGAKIKLGARASLL